LLEVISSIDAIDPAVVASWSVDGGKDECAETLIVQQHADMMSKRRLLL
jgi:hypothetical protein